MSGPRILVVEDDAALAASIAGYLGQHGYTAAIEKHGDRAAERILREQPELVTLDVILPGHDGLWVCRKVRAGYRGRILMLTARDQDRDEVTGLELGADDYLAKPVRPEVLLARVRALLRREGSRPEDPSVRLGELEVIPQLREARAHGVALPLSSAEFDVLALLAANAGAPLSRGALYEALRGGPYDPLDRAIDLRVSRLRHKLARAGLPDAIKTVRGVGYLCGRGS